LVQGARRATRLQWYKLGSRSLAIRPLGRDQIRLSIVASQKVRLAVPMETRLGAAWQARRVALPQRGTTRQRDLPGKVGRDLPGKVGRPGDAHRLLRRRGGTHGAERGAHDGASAFGYATMSAGDSATRARGSHLSTKLHRRRPVRGASPPPRASDPAAERSRGPCSHSRNTRSAPGTHLRRA
jgi:hypothetical protein